MLFSHQILNPPPKAAFAGIAFGCLGGFYALSYKFSEPFGPNLEACTSFSKFSGTTKSRPTTDQQDNQVKLALPLQQ
jgi:hypothetical protein